MLMFPDKGVIGGGGVEGVGWHRQVVERERREKDSKMHAPVPGRKPRRREREEERRKKQTKEKRLERKDDLPPNKPTRPERPFFQ